MQTKFTGTAEFGNAIGSVGNFIGDAERISSCIPDSRNFAKKDDTHFSIVAEMGLGAVKGEIPLRCAIEKAGNSQYLYLIEGHSFGSNVKVKLVLNLQDNGGSSTQINWDLSMELTGIIGAMGESAILHFAETYVDKIITNVKKEMAANKNR